MKTENSVHSHQTRHLDKWAVLSVIQKVDEAKNIAEMMNSSMEDLSEQMENL